MDFCNSFWGLNDAGVEVLFARMRIAAKTIDDLRSFWKERAAIEDEYAKRLLKLSKQTLGQGEVGELKNSLDVVRQETERQAGQHLSLSISIRKELEQPTQEFAAKQSNHKKAHQAPVEKTFKQKQLNETYVAKAKERYEQDCHRVNAYTAQQSLVQGRDLEKITMKLERAQSTVEGNKRDYQNFTRALEDTVARWDKEWKAFCDQCQDLEEERLEFMKDNIWAYANAVSTVCVNEDESCEAMRVALERLEVERDVEYFIAHHGTGPLIPEAPPFINYTATEPTPLKPETRVANFARSSNRPQSLMADLPKAAPEEEPADAGMVGVGAGHARANSHGQITTNNTGISGPPTQVPASSGAPVLPPVTSSPPNLGYPQSTNSISLNQGQGSYAKAMPALSSAPSQRRGSYQAADGNQNAGHSGPYKAELSKEAQITPGGPNDPIFAQLNKLREQPPPSESIRRGNTVSSRSGAQSHQPPSSVHGSAASHANAPNHAASPSMSSLSPPGARQSVDYQSQAEAIVGTHPSSRPSSPATAAAPHAAMMQPPRAHSTSPIPVEQVVSQYGQLLPGERPLSRNNTQNSTQRGRTTERGADSNQRAPSPGGFAGVGAKGRSPSPQPHRRGTSPGPGQIVSPQPHSNHPPTLQNQTLGQERKAAASPAMHASPSLRRAVSPSIGIKLDPSGNVEHDSMAEQYRSSSSPYQHPPAQPPQQQQPVTTAPKPQNPYGQQPAWNSYGQQQMQAPPGSQVQPGQQQWSAFSAAPPAPPPLNAVPPTGQPQQPVYGYGAGQPPMAAPPTSGYPQQYAYQQQQQPVAANAYPVNVPNSYTQPPPSQSQAMPPHQQSMSPMGSQPGLQQQIQPHQPRYQAQQQVQSPPQQQPPAAQQPAQNGRSPSPLPPTRNYIDDRGILFYVKALYDYTATIDEEFDFQAGDIIAVLATPDDGWWQGILLDDSRRQPGRTVFPSNFVCLF